MSPNVPRFASLKSRRTLVWALFAMVLGVAPWVFTSSLSQSLLSQMGIAIIVCLSYNILLGQGGMLSFGHAVYSGMGAFLAIHSLNSLGASGWLPVSLIPLVGGLASMALALVLGWLTTKKSATPFAMITLGIGELVWAMSLMFPALFGGEGGVSGNRVTGAPTLGISYGPQIQLYYLIALYTIVCTGLMFAFTQTPLGRMLNAVRDNPERVAFIGYDPQKVRYFSFVIAAFFAGISGGLAALHFEIVTSEVFSGTRSGAYLLFTFLGGSTFFFGPIIGAILMVLAFVLLSVFTKAWLLYLGVAFVLMVMFAPGGVASLIMVSLTLARSGQLHKYWFNYLALAFSAAVGLLGGAALIELLYHRQLQAALGSELDFMGVTLDSTGLSSWLGSLFVLLAGVALFEVSRRKLARDPSQVQRNTLPQNKPSEAS